MRKVLSRIAPILVISAVVACSPAKTADTCDESVFLGSDNTNSVLEVEWNHDGSKVAFAIWPHIEIWSRNGCEWESIHRIAKTGVWAIEWHPEQDLLAGIAGGNGETLRIWDAETGEMIYDMTRPRQPGMSGILITRDLDWSPDGSYIVSDSAQWDDTFLIWDLAEDAGPQPLASRLPPNPYHVVWDLELNPDGDLLLSSGTDDGVPVIRIWNPDDGAAISTITRGRGPLEWGPTGEQFAGANGFDINIWQLETEEIVTTFDKHNAGVASISWNRAAPLIASVDFDGNLKVWNVNSGTEYPLDDIQLTGLFSVDWSPDGTQLAVGGDEGVLILSFDLSLVTGR